MSKLWDKGYTLDPLAEAFTVGNDHLIDQKLVFYDCLGSIAHAAMLHKIGILNQEEWGKLHTALVGVLGSKEFLISQEEEDVHTAIENHLIKTIGDVGKKLHTARSRNDQVNVDLRLYMKKSLHFLLESLLHFAETLSLFAERYAEVPLVGRTHMQPAMPSSFGLWAGSYLESLLDDATLLIDFYSLIDQSPLGSAASYGVALAIDREYTSKLLGFGKVQNNVLYANQSRGKFEAAALHVCAQVMCDLSRLATDLIFYSLPEIGYLILDETLCSGSSLMPQKRNPCLLELVRAKSAKVNAYLHQVFEIIRPLPSGYQRDLQETKGPLVDGLETTILSLQVMQNMMLKLNIDREMCERGFTSEIYATDRVMKLVEQGIPFREAYRQVAYSLNELTLENSRENILSKTHLGGTGNLNLNHSAKAIHALSEWLNEQKNKWDQMVHHLVEEI